MRKSIFFAMILLLAISCDDSSSVGLPGAESLKMLPTERPSKEFIQSTNKIRREVGIREIKNNWFIGRNRIDVSGEQEVRIEEWSSPGSNGNEKVIRYMDGAIYSELDSYYSGDTYRSPNEDEGLLNVGIAIGYNYTTGLIRLFYSGPNKNIDRRVLSTVINNLHNDVILNDERLKIAQDILDQWGLEINE